MNVLKALLLAAVLVAAPAFAGHPVNVNTATVEQLAEALDGVGQSKAQAIVEYREQHGAFQHADELVNVKGIGLRTVDRNRDFIRVADAEAPSGEDSR